MSAEIGTMKVTEQIDALRALAVYPIDYLVVPRTLAMIVSMPLLVAECIAFGVVAGYFVAVYLLDVNGPYYVANMVRWTRPRDIIMAMTKACVFALLIVFISCHKGLTAREGAVGVGHPGQCRLDRHHSIGLGEERAQLARGIGGDGRA